MDIFTLPAWVDRFWAWYLGLPYWGMALVAVGSIVSLVFVLSIIWGWIEKLFEG